MGIPGRISCAMNFTNKLIKNNFLTSIPWEISKQITAEGYAPANVQITTNIIPNASFKISGRVIKLDPTKISESKYQENTISFNQLDHWQMERLTGHIRGEALRQLLSQNLISPRKQMAILKQPQLVLNSQPIGQHHPLTGGSPLKRDKAAYEQHQMGQIPQRSLPDA